MARIFRRTYKSVDSETGTEVTRRSKKWYADYVDAEGKRRRVPLSTDKQAAQAGLVEILRRVERQKAGLIEVDDDQLDQPVEGRVEEFREHLEAQGRAAKHISETIRHIRNALRKSGCTVLRDLQLGEEAISEYLAKRRKAGTSYRTINADLTSVRSFCRWLIGKGQLMSDPTAGLKKLSQSLDRRKERRSLTDDEACRLIETTLASQRIFRGLTGKDRAMLYMLAQRSGLRRKELCSLTPRSFNLDGSPPIVTVEAPQSKGRRKSVLPLPSEVAKELAAYLKGKRRTEAVWPGKWWEKSARMFARDLSDAGIEIVDENGKVLDFHGQRVTYITGLARTGVSPTKAQKLARHKDVNLTLKTYTHFQAQELADAVEGLPSLSPMRSPSGLPDEKSQEGIDIDLERVIKAWPTLSQRARNAIAQIVDDPGG